VGLAEPFFCPFSIAKNTEWRPGKNTVRHLKKLHRDLFTEAPDNFCSAQELKGTVPP